MGMAELQPESPTGTYSHSTPPPSLRTEIECMWGTLALPLCQTSLASCRTPEGVSLSLEGYWSAVFTSAQASHLSSYLPFSPSWQQEQPAPRSQPFSQSPGRISRGQWRRKEKMLAWVKMNDCRDHKRHPTTWDSKKDNEKNWSGWKVWGNERDPAATNLCQTFPVPEPYSCLCPTVSCQKTPTISSTAKGPLQPLLNRSCPRGPVPPCLTRCDLHNRLILPHLY